MTKERRKQGIEETALTRALRTAIGSLGWIVPQTEAEVEEQERTTECEEIDLPDSLQDARAALRPRLPLRLHDEIRLGAEDSLARAAREGTGSIDSGIEQRMRRDRLNAEARTAPDGTNSLRHGQAHLEPESKPRSERLSPARAQEIGDLAEFVSEEYFPRTPIDPEHILAKNFITLSFGSYGDAFDGMLECIDRRFHIFCNLDRVIDPESARARFTLAHEIGHFFIDSHRNALLRGTPPHASRCEYESDILIEQEADSFASHLLLPRTAFCAAAKKEGRGLAGILALSALFRTSLTATAIRYVQEDVIPCAVIKWGKDVYAWKWISMTMFHAGYRKTLEERKAIPADSATGRVLSGESLPFGTFHRQGSTASFWFPFITQGGQKDSILWEEAISLGRFGALTVLYFEK